MVVQVNYQDDLVTIESLENGKKKNNYIRYIVDEFSLEKAIKDLDNNKWAVAIDYIGDTDYLFQVEKHPKKPIIITKEFKNITELSIDFYMTMIPDWVVVSIKTPNDFCDMRLVESLSKKYNNIRFCGGKFLRLPNCNIGCIRREDIPARIGETKVSYYTEGCACIIKTVSLEELSEFGTYRLINKESIEEQEEQVEKEKKRVINSLSDLL